MDSKEDGNENNKEEEEEERLLMNSEMLSMTVAQLKNELAAREISIPPKALKADVLKLLQEAVKNNILLLYFLSSRSFLPSPLSPLPSPVSFPLPLQSHLHSLIWSTDKT